MQLCAITDRRCLERHEASLRQRLLSLVEGWAAGGVDFIQLREKDLDAHQLQSLAGEMMDTIGRNRAKLLVNISAPENAALALAASADGVHLAGKPAPGVVRGVRQSFRSWGREAIISVPCHDLDDIRVAVAEQVDLLLFSPVFEKFSVQPKGLEALSRACAEAQGIPVFALGGVTTANAPDCLAGGAAGVAGIRLFAGDEWRQLRAYPPLRRDP
jgi:thiamine-phosphate pyrophosphorylase